MKKQKQKAGRKLARTENPANPVVPLIEQAMNQMPDEKLKTLALTIEYSYNNLWGVYREWRNMPILPLLRLCKFMGMNEAQALELFQDQPEPRNKAPRYEKKALDDEDIVFGLEHPPAAVKHRSNPHQLNPTEEDKLDITNREEVSNISDDEK